jgi:hypothetical protein
MPALTAAFDITNGPIVSVAIGSSFVSRWAPGSGPPLPSLNRSMLIDTGAEDSVLERAIVKKLRIKTGQSSKKIRRGGQEVLRDAADVSLEVRGDTGDVLTLSFVLFAVEEEHRYYSQHGFVGLIGRDVLKVLTLHYFGGPSQFKLQW